MKPSLFTKITRNLPIAFLINLLVFIGAIIAAALEILVAGLRIPFYWTLNIVMPFVKLRVNISVLSKSLWDHGIPKTTSKLNLVKKLFTAIGMACLPGLAAFGRVPYAILKLPVNLVLEIRAFIINQSPDLQDPDRGWQTLITSDRLIHRLPLIPLVFSRVITTLQTDLTHNSWSYHIDIQIMDFNEPPQQSDSSSNRRSQDQASVLRSQSVTMGIHSSSPASLETDNVDARQLSGLPLKPRTPKPTKT